MSTRRGRPPIMAMLALSGAAVIMIASFTTDAADDKTVCIDSGGIYARANYGPGVNWLGYACVEPNTHTAPTTGTP